MEQWSQRKTFDLNNVFLFSSDAAPVSLETNLLIQPKH